MENLTKKVWAVFMGEHEYRRLVGVFDNYELAFAKVVDVRNEDEYLERETTSFTNSGVPPNWGQYDGVKGCTELTWWDDVEEWEVNGNRLNIEE